MRFFLVDAFTSQAFQGNPAGVVILDHYLSKDAMQKIAKEINQAETAFILHSNDDSFDYEVFYFTPTNEIEFCGHATIAGCLILSHEIKPYKQLRLKTNVGLIPIELSYRDGSLDIIYMTQVKPQFKPYKDSIDELLHLLKLDMSDYDSRFELFYGSTGNWDLFIPVKSKKAIEMACPDFNLLKEHNILHDITSVHLFTFDTDPYLIYARNFGPAVGINEDYVTGSSNGALVGYLLDYVKLPNHFTILQGNKQVRMGEIKVRIGNGDVQLGGIALKIIEGEINI